MPADGGHPHHAPERAILYPRSHLAPNAVPQHSTRGLCQANTRHGGASLLLLVLLQRKIEGTETINFLFGDVVDVGFLATRLTRRNMSTTLAVCTTTTCTAGRRSAAVIAFGCLFFSLFFGKAIFLTIFFKSRRRQRFRHFARRCVTCLDACRRFVRPQVGLLRPGHRSKRCTLLLL